MIMQFHGCTTLSVKNMLAYIGVYVHDNGS